MSKGSKLGSAIKSIKNEYWCYRLDPRSLIPLLKLVNRQIKKTAWQILLCYVLIRETIQDNESTSKLVTTLYRPLILGANLDQFKFIIVSRCIIPS